MSFVTRRIDVAIKLSQSGTNKPRTFAGTSLNTLSLTGYRTSVKLQNYGSVSLAKADILIYGVRPGLMNQLSTLGMVVQQVPNDSVTVTAGDDIGGMSTVFVGTVLEAIPDYDSSPDVPLRISARAGSAENAIPFPASSYSGGIDVATILSSIARRTGWGFENNGVSTRLSNPYYPGSALQQVAAICEHAGCRYDLAAGSAAGPSKVLAIWPMYGKRSVVGGVPLISPATGMIGYPSFTQGGIMVKTMFSPRIIMGGQIQVESSAFTIANLARLKNVASMWNVRGLDLALDAQVPHGQWMSTIYGFNPGFPNPIPQR